MFAWNNLGFFWFTEKFSVMEVEISALRVILLLFLDYSLFSQVILTDSEFRTWCFGWFYRIFEFDNHLFLGIHTNNTTFLIYIMQVL